jgi:hypothetical protein
MDRRNLLALVGTAAFTPFATIAELLIQNQLFDRGIKENRQTRVPNTRPPRSHKAASIMLRAPTHRHQRRTLWERLRSLFRALNFGG